MRQVQLIVVGEQLGDDRGGGHGEGTADCESHLPGQTDYQHAHRHGGECRHDDLGDADAKDDLAHCDEARNGHLEPDREQQEDDTDFGDLFDHVGIVNPAESVLAG